MLDEQGAFGDLTNVLVEDGTVAGLHAEAPEGVASFAGDGRWLMPGIVDCHAHLGCFTESTDVMLAMTATGWTLEVARNARTLLDLGVTVVRDPATGDPGVRDGIATGAVPGPTLRVSGRALSQTGGHGDGYVPALGVEAYSGPLMPEMHSHASAVVDGVDEVRKVVRRQIRAGVDWIKICVTGGLLSTMVDHPAKAEFSLEEVEMAVREAGRAHVPVAAHAYGGEGLTNAVVSGVRSIEHGIYLTSEQADLMAERGCWLVPTLVVVEELAALADDGLIPPSAAARVREIHEFSGQQVEVARSAGVRIAVGSDLVNQGRNLEELALLHRAGMPANEVLLAATRAGAELLGLDASHGRIAPGYDFDAVLCDTDPTSMEVFTTERPFSAVFRRGDLVRDDRVREAAFR